MIDPDGGRPTSVFCGWRPRSLEHDVHLTSFAMRYQSAEWERGNDLDFRADGIMVLHGERFLVELDTGEMSLRRVRERWKVYKDCRDKLLVVCLTARRRESVMSVSRGVAGLALFGVIDDEVWLDADGGEWRVE